MALTDQDLKKLANFLAQQRLMPTPSPYAAGLFPIPLCPCPCPWPIEDLDSQTKTKFEAILTQMKIRPSELFGILEHRIRLNQLTTAINALAVDLKI